MAHLNTLPYPLRKLEPSLNRPAPPPLRTKFLMPLASPQTLVGVSTPIDACEPLYPEALAHVPGRVVLVSYSDRCDVDTRARNLQVGRAAARVLEWILRPSHAHATQRL